MLKITFQKPKLPKVDLTKKRDEILTQISKNALNLCSKNDLRRKRQRAKAWNAYVKKFMINV